MLIIHTTDDTAEINQLTDLIFLATYLEELVRFAVPMFVFISGFVLYNKYKSDFSMREFYQKRFTVILIPYIIFSVVYCVERAYLGLVPTLSFNYIIDSIFNFNAAGLFWYIRLILILYILYPAIVAYYKIIKERLGIYTFPAFFVSIIIMYFLGAFVFALKFTVYRYFGYLIYFFFGIYVNDNYNQIRQWLERLPVKIVILLSLLIIILPFFSMYYYIDFRFHTHFTQSIHYYSQLMLISSHILHICIFILCLYLILHFNFKSSILKKIGEYSYGMYLCHAIFHLILTEGIYPQFSIVPTSLKYYLILFPVMLVSSFYTVHLMLSNNLTTYIISGKPRHH